MSRTPMKILLVNSPIRLSAKPNCIPYGLAVIAEVLRISGHEVEIYDINALRHDPEQVVSNLGKKSWDLVGVSGLITTLAYQLWIIGVLKRLNPMAAVVSGGGLATTHHRLLFENSPLDIAVLGEGEVTMMELVEALSSHGTPANVKGLVFRRGDDIFCTDPRENIHDLDALPFPAWDLLPMDVYLENPIWGDVANNSSGFRKDIRIRKSMNIISSRGCPFSCHYCYHLFGKSSYRFRSARNIINEMEILVEKYGVDFIGFVDDNMMASEKRLREFCKLLKEKPWSVFWGCHGRVSSAHPEILHLMADAGCVWIGYGIESGSQAILDAMNKKTTVEQSREAIVETRKAGIFPNTTFIFGYPGESVETIRETIEFKKSLDINSGSFFATPYPGTALYESVKHLIRDEREFIESLDDATCFSINLTRYDDSVLMLLKQAYDMKIDLALALQKVP